MHGIQQYELDPDGQAGVPTLEVHHFEASVVYDLGNWVHGGMLIRQLLVNSRAPISYSIIYRLSIFILTYLFTIKKQE